MTIQYTSPKPSLVFHVGEKTFNFVNGVLNVTEIEAEYIDAYMQTASMSVHALVRKVDKEAALKIAKDHQQRNKQAIHGGATSEDRPGAHVVREMRLESEAAAGNIQLPGEVAIGTDPNFTEIVAVKPGVTGVKSFIAKK